MARGGVAAAAAVAVCAAAVLARRADALARERVPVPVPAAEQAAGLFARPEDVAVVLPHQPADPAAPLPLVLALHDKCGDAEEAEEALPFSGVVDETPMIVAYPQAGRNPSWCTTCGVGPAWGCRYGAAAWDAWPECCAAGRAEPADDVRYLKDLVDAVAARHPVDPARVYVAGVGNGGMMAYRLACEWPEGLAGAFVMNGALPADALGACAAFGAQAGGAGGRVHLLHLHGVADTDVPYAGGQLRGRFAGGRDKRVASANASVAAWVEHMGCRSYDEVDIQLDIVTEAWPRRQRAETVPVRAAGCAPGGSAELWSVPNLRHDAGAELRRPELIKAVTLFFVTHPAGPPAPAVADATAANANAAAPAVAATNATESAPSSAAREPAAADSATDDAAGDLQQEGTIEMPQNVVAQSGPDETTAPTTEAPQAAADEPANEATAAPAAAAECDGDVKLCDDKISYVGRDPLLGCEFSPCPEQEQAAQPAQASPEPAAPAQASPEPAAPAQASPEPAAPAQASPEPAAPAQASPEPAAPAQEPPSSEATPEPAATPPAASDAGDDTDGLRVGAAPLADVNSDDDAGQSSPAARAALPVLAVASALLCGVA